MANQFRNYCMTINNPEETDEQFFDYCKGLPHIKYFVFSREKGEETGTQHFQIYIEFEQGKRFDYMKKAFPRAHIESRKGTKTQAREYCMKGDTHISGPFEYGTFAEERERTDIADCIAMIDAGERPDDVLAAYPGTYARNYKFLEQRYEQFLEREELGKYRKLKVVYIYGSPRTGKTSYVLNKHGHRSVFRMTDYGSFYNNERFDGYQWQEVLLFEEFRSSVKLENLLVYLDDYRPQLPARFHNKVGMYDIVYFCTNIPLSSQYPNAQVNYTNTWRAFVARIDEYWNFDWSTEQPVPRAKWFGPLPENEQLSF